MPASNPPAQDIDPALAERLQALRAALGLSVADMAQRVGLWGANGADNLRQMERGARPLPGTLQVLLGYMERQTTNQAAHSHALAITRPSADSLKARSLPLKKPPRDA